VDQGTCRDGIPAAVRARLSLGAHFSHFGKSFLAPIEQRTGLARAFSSRGTNSSRMDVLEAPCEKAIDEARRAAANVDDGRCRLRTDKFKQFERGDRGIGARIRAGQKES